MKAIILSILSTVWTISAFAAEQEWRQMPQPRPRLAETEATGPESQRSPRTSRDSSEVAVGMEKVVVRERADLPQPPQGLIEPQGKFTLTGGGRFVDAVKGGADVQVGLWPRSDKGDDTRFQPPRTRVDLEAMRVSW